MKKIAQDFKNGWNSIQNRYDLIVTDREMKYPKSLIREAWKRFKEECEVYHIDYTKYPYVHICYDDPTWQVNFHTDKDPCGPSFCLFDICFHSQKRKILQATFSKG